MKNLQYLVRLRAYARRYGLMKFPVQFVVAMYNADNR